MAPSLYVFTSNPVTLNQTKWINKLREEGYEPFIDAEHKSDYNWLKTRFVHDHRFYWITDNVEDFTADNLDSEMLFEPDIAISFDQGVTRNSDEWGLIKDFIEAIGFELPPPNISVILEKPIKRVGEAVSNEKPITEMGEENMDYDSYPIGLPDQYELVTKFIEEQDTMLYQVTKPFTDLPYTTLIHNYSEKGHLPFFTNLFICPSWGVWEKDIAFLNKIWLHFNMTGDFDIDKLLKERIESCYPSPTKVPEPEPVVYRRKWEDVYETLKKKYELRPLKRNKTDS